MPRPRKQYNEPKSVSDPVIIYKKILQGEEVPIQSEIKRKKVNLLRIGQKPVSYQQWKGKTEGIPNGMMVKTFVKDENFIFEARVDDKKSRQFRCVHVTQPIESGQWFRTPTRAFRTALKACGLQLNRSDSGRMICGMFSSVIQQVVFQTFGPSEEIVFQESKRQRLDEVSLAQTTKDEPMNDDLSWSWLLDNFLAADDRAELVVPPVAIGDEPGKVDDLIPFEFYGQAEFPVPLVAPTNLESDELFSSPVLNFQDLFDEIDP
jgi:hypothetical protein